MGQPENKNQNFELTGREFLYQFFLFHIGKKETPSYNIKNRKEVKSVELVITLFVLAGLFYYLFIFMNVRYTISGDTLIIKYGFSTFTILIADIIDINESEYYLELNNNTLIGSSNEKNERMLLCTKTENYLCSSKMKLDMMEQLKELNPAIKCYLNR